MKRILIAAILVFFGPIQASHVLVKTKEVEAGESDKLKAEQVAVTQDMPPSTILGKIADNENFDKRELFIADSIRLRNENSKIPIHHRGDHIFRVATYNVHFWIDALGNPSYENIMQVIKNINPDVLILQEVDNGPTRYNRLSEEQLAKRFHDLGYEYQKFCQAAMFRGAPFGNMILSKYPTQFTSKIFKVDEDNPRERRCFIHALIDLPNQEKLSLYGTHLDVWDESEKTRSEEIAELIAIADKDTNKNIVIAGDFNALRKKDYAYTIKGKNAWELIQRDDQMRGIMNTPIDALELIEKAGFADSFSKAALTGPKFTVWPGRVVDFIFLKDSWNLPLQGSYVYYDAASDHLPIILDINIGASHFPGGKRD